MKHPERLNVHGWQYDHPGIFLLWLFAEALGIVGIVGAVAVVAHLLSR